MITKRSWICEICHETYPNEHKVGCREALEKENAALNAELWKTKEDRERWADSACRLEKALDKMKEKVEHSEALAEKMAEAIRADNSKSEYQINLDKILALFDAKRGEDKKLWQK